MEMLIENKGEKLEKLKVYKSSAREKNRENLNQEGK
jgi:hypothetical protein